jgi:hypothetical protein
MASYMVMYEGGPLGGKLGSYQWLVAPDALLFQGPEEPVEEDGRIQAHRYNLIESVKADPPMRGYSAHYRYAGRYRVLPGMAKKADFT